MVSAHHNFIESKNSCSRSFSSTLLGESFITLCWGTAPVARALASKPKFILADEPTANLDSKSTSNLLDIMSQLNEAENITFIFSTHDQRVIDRARRVVTLEDGKIVNDNKK